MWLARFFNDEGIHNANLQCITEQFFKAFLVFLTALCLQGDQHLACTADSPTLLEGREPESLFHQGSDG